VRRGVEAHRAYNMKKLAGKTSTVNGENVSGGKPVEVEHRTLI
jgi:hypothetical protein